MKTLLNLLAICSILLLQYESRAQGGPEKKVKLGISLAQASDNKITQAEAANFAATFQKDGESKDNYLINGYFGLDLEFDPLSTLSAISELQRNTLITKKQSVQQYGLKFYHGFVLSERDNEIQGKIDLDLSAKHSRDLIKGTKGFQFIAAGNINFAQPFESAFLNCIKPNQVIPAAEAGGFANWMQYRHSHSAGVEYIGYEKLAMLSGTFNLEVYPLSGFLYKAFEKYNLLQLKWTITDRAKISSEHTDLYVGTSQTLGAALNIKFTGVNAITIGYEQVKGGNPMKGLDDQEYGQLALGARIKL